MNTTNTTTGTMTSNTTSFIFEQQYYPKELKDVIVTDETIEIIYVERAIQPSYSYTITIGGEIQQPTYPDRTVKMIYGSRDGALTLLNTVYGRVVPPQILPESYEFDE